MTKEKTNADQLITTIIGGIEEVKGKEITILDLREILLFVKVLLIHR